MKTRSSCRGACLTGAVLVWLCSAAYGQFGDRIQSPLSGSPTVSPYINLFRGGSGGGPVLNYFGMVQPQLQAQQQASQFSSSINQLQMGGGRGLSSGGGIGYYGMGMTGHPAVFMSINGIGGAGGGFGGGFGGGGSGGGQQFGGQQFGGVGSMGGAYGGGMMNQGMGGTGMSGMGYGGVSAYGGGIPTGMNPAMIGPMPPSSLPMNGGGYSGHPAVFGIYGNSAPAVRTR